MKKRLSKEIYIYLDDENDVLEILDLKDTPILIESEARIAKYKLESEGVFFYPPAKFVPNKKKRKTANGE